MEFNTALTASILMSELQEINKKHADIIKQKKNINSNLILNCKGLNDENILVGIPLEDAKRVLQMVEDYYENKQDAKHQEIDQLN